MKCSCVMKGAGLSETMDSTKVFRKMFMTMFCRTMKVIGKAR